ncbi:MAG: serine O-acetyltransferase [Alphaproteobacteria bacterium]|jgi:serine O-acetyltransferase|nr:MAG: serine O-acetyltransferase [Alphaproteobacteria bacterium]
MMEASIPNTGAPAPIWQKLRFDAKAAADQEPTLSSYLAATVLNHENFTQALCYQLAQKAGGPDMSALAVREICEEAYKSDPSIVAAAERDLQAVLERDPATRSTLQPFLFFKGFLALETHRVAHWLFGQGRETLAFFLQSRISELYSVDIHPAAPIGHGVFMDHATGIVIGETARVGNDVSMLHGVTLGGTGKVYTDRHPKIGNGVLLGAGSKVLGNIKIGDEARVGSGSVVLSDVPARCSVAGVPAKPVGGACMKPAQTMDQKFDMGL